VSRRATAHVSVLLAVSVSALAVPALVQAQSGGAAPSSGGSSPTASGSGSQVQPGNTTVSVSGNGITVATKVSGILRRPQRFSGSVGPENAGKTVEVERRGRQTGWRWAWTTHGTVQSDGSFSAVWPTNHIGRFSIRAEIVDGQSARTAAAASPTLTMTVYRPSLATQYGPGFYGQKTACGETLHRNTLGVANRTLPCGTPVAIYYHGRTLVVRVIDRGPYAHHADWDLTEATGSALQIDGTAIIGAVSLPRASS
jgi:rare lipoprotein A